jgi:hypothetical protein
VTLLVVLRVHAAREIGRENMLAPRKGVVQNRWIIAG